MVCIPALHLTPYHVIPGEFGVVYKAKLSGIREDEVVAVKTLKGIALGQPNSWLLLLYLYLLLLLLHDFLCCSFLFCVAVECCCCC